METMIQAIVKFQVLLQYLDASRLREDDISFKLRPINFSRL